MSGGANTMQMGTISPSAASQLTSAGYQVPQSLIQSLGIKGATSPVAPIQYSGNAAHYTPNPFTASQIANTPSQMSPALQQAYAAKMARMGAPLANGTGQGMTIGGLL